MRIGVITGEFPPMEGGIGAFCNTLTTRLSDLGQTVAILTDVRAEKQDPRVALTAAPGRWNWVALRAVSRWIDSERLDVVNLHFQTGMYQMSPWMHILPNWVSKTPVVTTFHDLRVPYLFPKAGALRLKAVQWLARHSARVISTNPEDHATLESWGVQSTVIPIGSNVHSVAITAEERRAVHARMQGSSKAIVLTHFGFLNHSKGIEHLMTAAAALRKRGLTVRIWMIGGRLGASDPTNALWAEKLDDLIGELDLQDCIEWTGYVSEQEAAAYLHAADIVCLPFLDGVSPRRSSLVAALAQGSCILTTEPAVKIDSFQHGENLWLVPAGDSHMLEEGLLTLISDAPLRERLRAGAERLAQDYDWSTIAYKTQSALESALSGRPR